MISLNTRFLSTSFGELQATAVRRKAINILTNNGRECSTAAYLWNFQNVLSSILIIALTMVFILFSILVLRGTSLPKWIYFAFAALSFYSEHDCAMT